MTCGEEHLFHKSSCAHIVSSNTLIHLRTCTDVSAEHAPPASSPACPQSSADDVASTPCAMCVSYEEEEDTCVI
jgi:hypothetical protein